MFPPGSAAFPTAGRRALPLIAGLALAAAGCEPTGGIRGADLEAGTEIETAVGGAAIRDTRGPSVPVPAGTELIVRLDRQISAQENRVGDRFSATVARPVIMGDRVLIPSGARVRGVIAAIHDSEPAAGVVVIDLEIREIAIAQQIHPLRASVVEANPQWVARKGGDGSAPKVETGERLDPGIRGLRPDRGRSRDRDGRGQLVGSGDDEAAETVTSIVIGTASHLAVLPEGSIMRLRLNAPLRLPGEPAAVA